VNFVQDKKPIRFIRRINPAMPIPASASSSHDMHREDIARCLRFEVFAQNLAFFLLFLGTPTILVSSTFSEEGDQRVSFGNNLAKSPDAFDVVPFSRYHGNRK
jgi:hypothetical protein